MRAFQRLRQAVNAERTQSSEVREALVATLFASPFSLLIGAVVGSLTALVTARATTDIWIHIVACAIPTIGIARLVHCYYAKGFRTGAPSPGNEFLYEIGAWAYAGAIGSLAFLALLRTSDAQVHLLTSCVAIGYAAGICARNAARPFIAIGQLTFSSLPVTVALFLSGGTAQVVLGIISLLFVGGMMSITAQIYLAISNALLSAQRSAARARNTLDSIPQMVWSHSADGTDEYYNRQWDAFTGGALRAGQIKRVDLIHPEDCDRVSKVWLDCFRSGEDYEAEYRILHHSGEYRWVFGRGRAARDKDGNVVRWYGSCTDIHDRVLALQALNESEALNRGIIEASPDCVSLLDARGRVLFLNRAAQEAFPSGAPPGLLGQRWGAEILQGTSEKRPSTRRGAAGSVASRWPPRRMRTAAAGSILFWRRCWTPRADQQRSSSRLVM